MSDYDGYEKIDLNAILQAHFVEGDGIWLDIQPEVVLVYRGRNSVWEMVAQITREKPEALGIEIELFLAPSRLDDFSGGHWHNDPYSGGVDFEIVVYPDDE